jgi:hypothetical protein
MNKASGVQKFAETVWTSGLVFVKAAAYRSKENASTQNSALTRAGSAIESRIELESRKRP